ncbi:hypothetical protein OJ252_498 [Cryptosporidium canis]|uniref:Alkyl transferase n=1 Tax=Cryptosporidium canis TaxID=195482 RepID=A0ABQ8PCX2_9CRYT|nr:hypothetical protein OJ252_498 [Cryptosporidium canis]
MIAILEELLEASLVRFLSIFSISHVAIVLDGNRRYAKSMGISQLEGHKQGALLIKKVLPLFIKLRIKYVSMFVFSIENFSRERENVDNTFRVIRDYIVAEEDWLNECNSRVVVSGKIEMLPGDLMETLSNLELKTRKNTGIVLNICCAYSSTSELELASKRYLNSLKDSHQALGLFDLPGLPQHEDLLSENSLAPDQQPKDSYNHPTLCYFLPINLYCGLYPKDTQFPVHHLTCRVP